MPIQVRLESHTTDVNQLALVPHGAEQLACYVSKNDAGNKHSVIEVRRSDSSILYREDLAGQGVDHIFDLAGWRSRSSGTLKLQILTWPQGQSFTNQRQRVIIDTGIRIDPPEDRTQG